MSWVPIDCTLPTTQQPLRVAEFDTLFATALRRVSRPTPHRLSTLQEPTDEFDESRLRIHTLAGRRRHHAHRRRRPRRRRRGRAGQGARRRALRFRRCVHPTCPRETAAAPDPFHGPARRRSSAPLQARAAHLSPPCRERRCVHRPNQPRPWVPHSSRPHRDGWVPLLLVPPPARSASPQTHAPQQQQPPPPARPADPPTDPPQPAPRGPQFRRLRRNRRQAPTPCGSACSSATCASAWRSRATTPRPGPRPRFA